MGKSISKLSSNKASARSAPESDKTGCFCYEIPEVKQRIHVTVKNVSRNIQTVDLTKKDMYFLNQNADFSTSQSLHSFEKENPGQIGISSKWDLSLVVNPTFVDNSRLNLYLYMARNKSAIANKNWRNKINKSNNINPNVLVPIHTKWVGNIHVVCNDLMNVAENKMQKLLENIPTQMDTRNEGCIFEMHSGPNAGRYLGSVTWNTETINSLKEVSQTKSIDLVLDGCITFSGLSVVKLPQNEVEGFYNKSLESNKEWLDIRKSLLQDSPKSVSDVKLIFPESNVQIKAHRIVLAVFSPVFANMFQSKMMEAETGEIKIQDVSSDAMIYAVELLYMGGPPSQGFGLGVDLSKSEMNWCKYAEEIVYVADKYQIQSLKQFCDRNLSRNCSKENALDLFRTAKLYGLERAKKEILTFIEINM